MKAIKATAILSNGFVSYDPMSPAIDSMIGYLYTIGKDSDLVSPCGELSTHDDLPIEKEFDGDDWWYQCSMPIYYAATDHVRYFHRRFDAQYAERYMENVRGKIATSSGPTKNFRLSSIVHVCDSVSWHLVCDDWCVESLPKLTHIGARTGAGEGRVIRWEFDDGDAEIARTHRPLPSEWATRNNINGYNIYWGYRPPVRLSCNKTICTVPRGAA